MRCSVMQTTWSSLSLLTPSKLVVRGRALLDNRTEKRTGVTALHERLQKNIYRASQGPPVYLANRRDGRHWTEFRLRLPSTLSFLVLSTELFAEFSIQSKVQNTPFMMTRAMGSWPKDSPTHPPSPDDANQCMRVSSALDAGTVWSADLRIFAPFLSLKTFGLRNFKASRLEIPDAQGKCERINSKWINPSSFLTTMGKPGTEVLNAPALAHLGTGMAQTSDDSVACEHLLHSYTLELLDITTEDKGGPGMCKMFGDIIVDSYDEYKG
ncbi:hypothetical protein C8J57DRAFT_1224688 [Mycena rebaudengoi]|nr:hypothetical protein C8J57DRAFT_1224688 [Mycena rebaudengoi]